VDASNRTQDSWLTAGGTPVVPQIRWLHALADARASETFILIPIEIQGKLIDNYDKINTCT
jgi:hypothetical protein